MNTKSLRIVRCNSPSASILTVLGAGEVSRRNLLAGGESDPGGTPQEALVAPDGTGAEAIEVLWLKAVPAMSGPRRKRLKTPRFIATSRGIGWGRSNDLFWGANGSTPMLLVRI